MCDVGQMLALYQHFLLNRPPGTRWTSFIYIELCMDVSLSNIAEDFTVVFAVNQPMLFKWLQGYWLIMDEYRDNLIPDKGVVTSTSSTA